METKKYKITCKGCSHDLWLSTFAQDVARCDKKQCWGQTKKARELAAYEGQVAPEDFLPVTSTKITVHEEPEPTPVHVEQQSGYYDHGKWVPWGHPHYGDCD